MTTRIGPTFSTRPAAAGTSRTSRCLARADMCSLCDPKRCSGYGLKELDVLRQWKLGRGEYQYDGSVWVEDALASRSDAGAEGGDAWNWVSSKSDAVLGSLANQSTIAAGYHQHFFYGATANVGPSIPATHSRRTCTWIRTIRRPKSCCNGTATPGTPGVLGCEPNHLRRLREHPAAFLMGGLRCRPVGQLTVPRPRSAWKGVCSRNGFLRCMMDAATWDSRRHRRDCGHQ